MEPIVTLITSLIFISLLGIVVAFSPTLVITELTILTRSKRAILHSVAFITGIALAVAAFCFIALFFIDPAHEIVLPSTREVIHGIPLTDILIGSLFVFIGSRLFRPRPTAVVAKPSRFRPEKLLETKTLFWFGFLKMATSLSSIAAILFAIRYILTTIDVSALRLMFVLLLVCVAVLPFILIVLLKQYRPRSFTHIQSASDRAVTIRWRRVLAVTFIVVGSYFILNGVLHWD